MRFCLYTMHAPSLAEMSAMTVPNKIEYCQRHGYSYYQEPYTGAMWPGFERLPPLIGLLKSKLFDWVFWLGTDCLITNLNQKLETIVALDPRAGLVISVDAFDLQMDAFLVRASDSRAIALLERVFDMRHNPPGTHEEQSSLSSIFRQPEFGDCVKLMPRLMRFILIARSASSALWTRKYCRSDSNTASLNLHRSRFWRWQTANRRNPSDRTE